MSDRLKKIWADFEGQTNRNLTGNGVDNIHVPNRKEWRTDDNRFLPDQFEAPAERAFAALTWKLSEAEKRLTRKRSKFKDDETRFAYGDPNEDRSHCLLYTSDAADE